MADPGAGTGSARDAAVSNDESYADALRRRAGDPEKTAVEAAQRAVDKAKDQLEAAKDALANAKASAKT